MYIEHNHIFESIQPAQRERERESERDRQTDHGRGAEQERGGTVGTMAAVISRDKHRLKECTTCRAGYTFGRHFLSPRQACAAQQLTCDCVDSGGAAAELCAVGENFLFSSLA